jgi:hypothetical protein
LIELDIDYKTIQQGRKSTHKRNIETRSHNIVAVAKKVINLISDCDSLALIILNENRMRLIIFSSVTCLPLPFFVHIIS